MTNSLPSQPQSPRRGFTMIELLTVILIISLLMSLGFPVYFGVIKKLAGQRTTALVSAVSAAIATYGVTTITIPNEGIRRLWDFDGDGVLDGDPAKSFSGLVKTQAASAGYRGFLAMTGVALEKRNVEPLTLRILDGWKRPLRISFAVNGKDHTYGPTGLGIWSFGPKGPSTADPAVPAVPADVITSWKGR